MIVCICHRVSDRDIARAVRAGCESFEALQDDLRVATACGACHDCASATFREHALPAGASAFSAAAMAPATHTGHTLHTVHLPMPMRRKLVPAQGTV